MSFKWSKRYEVEQRREKVKELIGLGYSLADIARENGYSLHTVKKDSNVIRKRSTEYFQKYVTEQIPYELDVALASLKTIKRQAKEISEAAQDDYRVKVRALDLLERVTMSYIDLKMRGDVVGRAMKVAQFYQGKANELAKGEPEDEEEELGEEYDPQAVF